MSLNGRRQPTPRRRKSKRAPPSPAARDRGGDGEGGALYTMSTLKTDMPATARGDVSRKRFDSRKSPASGGRSASAATTRGHRCPIEDHLATRGYASSSRAAKILSSKDRSRSSRRTSNQNAFLKTLGTSSKPPPKNETCRDNTESGTAEGATGASVVSAAFNETLKNIENVRDVVGNDTRKFTDFPSPTNVLLSPPTMLGNVDVFFPADNNSKHFFGGKGGELISHNQIESLFQNDVVPLDKRTGKDTMRICGRSNENSNVCESDIVEPHVADEKIPEEREKDSKKSNPDATKKLPGKWTTAEDSKLRHAVNYYGGKEWKNIAAMLGTNRTSVQCLHRWNKVLKPGLVKGPWTPTEDHVVTSMVLTHGIGKVKWSDIAANLSGRIGKQCRERWFNHLDPDINKGPWTPGEDDVLFGSQEKMGNRWCDIAKLLPGRTENMVKNRFNSSARKKWLKKNGKEFDEAAMGVRRRPRRKSKKKKTPRKKREKKPTQKKRLPRSDRQVLLNKADGMHYAFIEPTDITSVPSPRLFDIHKTLTPAAYASVGFGSRSPRAALAARDHTSFPGTCSSSHATNRSKSRDNTSNIISLLSVDDDVQSLQDFTKGFPSPSNMIFSPSSSSSTWAALTSPHGALH